MISVFLRLSATIVVIILPDVDVGLFLWKFFYEYNPTRLIISL